MKLDSVAFDKKYLVKQANEHVHDLFKHGTNCPTLWPLARHHQQIHINWCISLMSYTVF